MIHVGDVMRVCRNYFPVGFTHGAWRIEGGRLSPAFDASPGDWIAVSGSLRSDGVYQLDTDGLLPGASDEAFTGSVWLLAPPRDFLRLCEEIAAYQQAHPASPVQAERFGQYSATLAPGAEGSWQAVFRKALQSYQRMFSEVMV